MTPLKHGDRVVHTYVEDEVGTVVGEELPCQEVQVVWDSTPDVVDVHPVWNLRLHVEPITDLPRAYALT